MLWRFLISLFCVSVASAALAEVPLIVVETQPLASNVRRVLQTHQALGHPLAKEAVDEIRNAIKTQDAAAIQIAVDPHVLAVVNINPEERVSVRRGPAKGILQQGGFLPVLVKVINHGTSTSRLQVSSPQAGPLYAGTSELSMRRQQQIPLLENQNVSGATDRFLGVEVYRKQPMTEQLSGLEVEYIIVLLASADAGKREAVLHFDIGDGTADLEHRNELPVLFDAKPSFPLKLSITEDGKPTIARLEFRDAIGRVYPLQPKRVMPDFFFQPQVYRKDGESVWLPPGTYDVRYSRGPEYVVGETEIAIGSDNQNHLNVQLQRWFNANDHGFFSGDHHIHAAGCAHYTSPTKGVTPADMFRQVRGEGLNVGCVLTWGPCFEYQRNFFNANANMFDSDDTLLKYDLEISGFGSQALGHVCLLNLSDQTYPDSEGTKTKGWPTWTTPVMRWAKEQGGYAGYAHSASGLHIDPESAAGRLMSRCDDDGNGMLGRRECENVLLPFAYSRSDLDRDGQLSKDELIAAHLRAAEQLPNYAVPEMNGVGAMEICVSTVAGVCDFISAMDTRRIQEWNTWYHLLNCGFPLKVSGETDFPCMSSRRVGQGRVYVHLGKDAKLDFVDWCRAMAQGRSYVSDGYAQLPRFTVNDVAPGYGDVKLAEPRTVRVVAEVAFAPQVPKGVAYGTLDSEGGRAVTGDTVVLHRPRDEGWLVGGRRQVEIIVNALPVATREIPSDGKTHRIEIDVPIEQSSWIAIRQFPQLHSNPVNVIVGETPIRASANSARWCIEMTELLWKNRERKIAKEEREAAKEAFDHALAVLREIESECKE